MRSMPCLVPVSASQCLAHSASCGYPLRIVGVVGAGHLDGLKRNWTRRDIDVRLLMEVPGENVAIEEGAEEDDHKYGDEPVYRSGDEVLDLKALMRWRRRKRRRVLVTAAGCTAVVCVIVVALVSWSRSHPRLHRLVERYA